MSQEESGQDQKTGQPGSAGGQEADDKKTIAELTEKVAFLEKKLQIVGSVTRHDVLNQMTAIVGYNELLGMMVEDPKFRSFLEKEKFALNKIRRQFQFAKDYQNIAVDPPRWQNIRNLVSRVSEDFDVKQVRIIADTGTASVLADPLFDRVFHHLFDNALRHGETVTEITISLQQTGPSGLLLVENNGASIPAAEKEKIFERGYGKGTGWGLFLAREILAVTGMTITETGEPGKGVRFEITLPPGSFRLDDADSPAREAGCRLFPGHTRQREVSAYSPGNYRKRGYAPAAGATATNYPSPRVIILKDLSRTEREISYEECCAAFIFSASIATQTSTSFCFGFVNRLSYTSKSNVYVRGGRTTRPCSRPRGSRPASALLP